MQLQHVENVAQAPALPAAVYPTTLKEKEPAVAPKHVNAIGTIERPQHIIMEK